MTYDEARSLVKTGDLIAVKGRNFFARAVRLVTGSPYSHTGIAVWIEGRLLVAHSTGSGCNLVPLSQYGSADFDVFACPINRVFVRDQIWWTLGQHISYDLVDLARIALHLWLRVPLPSRDRGGMVCSSLSAFIYEKAGWKAILPSIPWPGVLAAALGQPLISVTH